MIGGANPFGELLQQLSQGMSSVWASPILHDFGQQQDAQHTTADRFAWIPTDLDHGPQPFQLPDQVNPSRQICGFDVSIYGANYDRILELHALLVGWLDLLVGPPQGAAPSEDATPAVLRGTTDLATLVYPYSGLVGLLLHTTLPTARVFPFPSTPLASPQAIADTVMQRANAVGLALRARLAKGDAGERYLELVLPADPLSATGSTLALDPSAASSACAVLGFSSFDANISATSSPPSWPYRPGYVVGPASSPGVRGGDLAAHGWGAIVPVTLYRPIASMRFPVGVVVTTPLDVTATGGSTPDETAISTP